MPDIKQRCLKLALEGYSVGAIARALKRDKSRVSRHLKYWVEVGCLINTAPRGEPANFVRGPNLPKQTKEVLPPRNSTSNDMTVGTVGYGPIIEDLPIIGGKPEPRFIPMRCHALGHRFPVLKGPDNGVPWTRTSHPSGVPNHVLIVPLDTDPLSDRHVKVVYREGKESQSLEIWTPEVVITTPDALNDFSKWATNRAQRVANWLTRKYGFEFGLPEYCQSPHYAAAVPREVAQAAKEIGLKGPEIWWDTSRGRGELETSKEKMAVALQTLPHRVSNLEAGLVPTLEKLVEVQNGLVEGQEMLLKSHTALLEYLQKLLGDNAPAPPTPPDSDPGGMYG